MAFTHPVEIRYLEVDQQGVVFNMWYLAYLDDAVTAFLAHVGFPYTVMLDAGFDVQLVHTELDWHDVVHAGVHGPRRRARRAHGRERAATGRRGVRTGRRTPGSPWR